MSGAAVNKKIAKGLAKAGKVLGWPFSVYRPVNYVSPFSDENLVFTKQMALSQDDGFKKNPEDTLAYNVVYTDFRKLEPGDILHILDLGSTYIVTENNPIRGAVAVKATHTMDEKRVRYTPTEDVKTSNDVIYTSVPCAVKFKSQFNDPSVLTGVGSSGTGHRSMAEIWTWMPVGALQSSDTISLNDDTFTIVSLTQDSGGTVITVRSTKIGT